MLEFVNEDNLLGMLEFVKSVIQHCKNFRHFDHIRFDKLEEDITFTFLELASLVDNRLRCGYFAIFKEI